MVCRFFKIMISHATDVNQPVGKITQRHLNRCADCRRFHESCRIMGDELRAEAVNLNHTQSLSAERITKILSGFSTRPRHTQFRLMPFAAAACIALAAVAGMRFFLRLPEHRPHDETPISVNVILNTDVQTAWPGWVEEPLAGEMKNLVRYTESTIRFLVACVNVDPLQKSTVRK